MSDQTPPPYGSAPGYGPGGDGGSPTPPPSYPSYPGDGGDGGVPPTAPPAYGAPGPAQPYSVGEAVGVGFRLFGKNAGSFIAMALTILVATLIFGALSYATSDHETSTTSSSISFNSQLTPLALVFNLLASFVSTLLSAALARGAIDAVDGKQVSFGAMFEGWDKLQVLIASLIVSVLTLIGTIACILPGLIVAFLLWYTNFFIVDARRQAFEGIGDSFRFTKGHVGPLLLTAIVAFLINIVGACLVGVGLLVSVPVTMIMAGVAYRMLQGRPIHDGR